MTSLFPSVTEQMDLIRRGIAEIVPEEDLARRIEKSIASGVPLNVKLGCDPSRPDLHIGHSVVLRKLRQFQDLGHKAILIVGDFTGMIGDPSGRNRTRPPLTLEETRRNGQTYLEQATKILSTKKIQMLYNSEWLGKMTFADVIMLASRYTTARMLERDDFEKRFRAREPIGMHELLYPLAQAMDSVAVQADVELGGTDQKFNLLVGRDIQREYGLDPQVIITMPILPGTDGVEKMSKSLDNHIGISESPAQMYGKVLSIPDSVILSYFVLTTSVEPEEIVSIEKQLQEPGINPRDLKRRLAREVVTLYHSREAAVESEREFDRIFIEKEVPSDIQERILPLKGGVISILQLLTTTQMVSSNGEARRLVSQGGISIDGRKVTDVNEIISPGEGIVVKVGKRKFLKVKVDKG